MDALGAVSAPTASGAGEAPVERRSEPRTPTNWIAMIHLGDGAEFPCTVKDVSKSGARLGLPETIVLPDQFLLKVLGYSFLLRVRLVWRSGHHAGVRIERFGKGPLPVVAPEEPAAPADTPERYTTLGRRRRRVSQL